MSMQNVINDAVVVSSAINAFSNKDLNYLNKTPIDLEIKPIAQRYTRSNFNAITFKKIVQPTKLKTSLF